MKKPRKHVVAVWVDIPSEERYLAEIEANFSTNLERASYQITEIIEPKRRRK